ncbi:hypothetical protein ACUNWD_08280 [Sunxiuqinia sp. A32]|uniref:hypothetical protein n=1 Tax=Sunxiuqinia sp. A32 TaxID=3461496 RepID=UPI0040464813
MKRTSKQKGTGYFNEAIEVISSNLQDDQLRKLLSRLNDLLNYSRKHLIDKDYEGYFKSTKMAFHAAHDLNNDVLKDYSELFMTFIKDSLAETRTELKIMSSGIFGKKKYLRYVQQANLLLEEFENYRVAASDLDSFDISQFEHTKHRSGKK